MKLLVIYGTTEGQTRKIARFVAEIVEKAGNTVDVIDAANVDADFVIPNSDAVMIAASVHIGRYQSAIMHLVTNNRDRLAASPTAFLSVSLAAAGDENDLKDVSECVEGFMRETGWTPGVVEHVAGAFRYTQYDFFKRWAMKYIAMRHDRPTDTNRDFELTDWVALRRFLDSFLRPFSS